jgi:ABC-2 type transport system permease protein
MNTHRRFIDNSFIALLPALQVEYQKTRRSKTLWITAVAFAFVSLIGGLFMFILKDPELAKSLGIVGAKAQIFGGTADWLSFFNLILLLLSIGGLVIFGFIFIWIFGREFSDKTVYDMLALPTSRVTIVLAKIITATCWSLVLTILVFLLMLGVGAALQLPGWSGDLVWNGFGMIIATSCMTILICIPFALAASVTRGYLPAVGCIFLVLILGQVFSRLGYGPYFPWDIPVLYSGAAEALTGAPPEPLEAISYILVGIVGLLSVVGTGIWWRNADQT